MDLQGKTIVTTGSTETSSNLTKSLKKYSAKVIEFPTIKTVPILKNPDFDQVLKKISEIHWIVFTSKSAVKYFLDACFAANISINTLQNIKVAAMGPASASYIKKQGLKVSFIPDKAVAESFIENFTQANDLNGKEVLIPRSKIGRTIVSEGLIKAGARIYDIPIYDTISPTYSEDEKNQLKSMITQEKLDWICFTSSSTVVNFVKILGESFIGKNKNMIKIASIGPITSATIADLGLLLGLEACEYTIDGLVNKILEKENK